VNHSIVSAILLLSLGGAAFAGGPTGVTDDPVPAPPASAAAHDWSGPYVGLSYGTTTADMDFAVGGLFEFENGTAAGLYAGYLFQRGSFVYGGELAYGKISGAFLPNPGFSGDDEIDRVLDLKARVGFASNRALFYGVVGYSRSNYVEPPLIEMDTNGFSYGLGAEVAVSPRLVVGLEYLGRDLSGSALGGTISADQNLDTLNLRVGLNF
jgi:outer membrane immunogenic protein